ELVTLAAVHPMDVLAAVGAHGLVRHPDEPGVGVLGPVLDEERRSPPVGSAIEQRNERASLDVRGGRAAGEFDQRRREILADDQTVDPRALPDRLRIAGDERTANAFLVCETALGTERVLAEEIAVVAEEHD